MRYSTASLPSLLAPRGCVPLRRRLRVAISYRGRSAGPGLSHQGHTRTICQTGDNHPQKIICVNPIYRRPQMGRSRPKRKYTNRKNQPPSGRRPWSWRPPLYTVAFLILCQKTSVESVAQEGGRRLGRDYQHQERPETTTTTLTPLLTSSGSCRWPFLWPVHPPACPGNGSVAPAYPRSPPPGSRRSRR